VLDRTQSTVQCTSQPEVIILWLSGVYLPLQFTTANSEFWEEVPLKE